MHYIDPMSMVDLPRLMHQSKSSVAGLNRYIIL